MTPLAQYVQTELRTLAIVQSPQPTLHPRPIPSLIPMLTWRDTLTFFAASFASMFASCIDQVSIAGNVPSFFTWGGVGVMLTFQGRGGG